DHFLPGMVGMQRGHDALDRIVEQDSTDALLPIELEAVRGAEEGFELPDRLALIVEDGPSAADPARIDRWPAGFDRPGLGPNLLLDLATEAVGIREAVLHTGELIGAEIGQMCLAGQG